MSTKPRNAEEFALKFFKVAAAVGFVLSLFLHVKSLIGEIALEHPMFLHFGIFCVFIPAILSSTKKGFRRVPADIFWKETLEFCPLWMKNGLKIIAGYAGVNFFLFMVATRDIPKSHYSSGQTSLWEVRMFSGHWMLFYYVSFSILYSALEKKKRVYCPLCEARLFPTDKLCPSCGAHVRKS